MQSLRNWAGFGALLGCLGFLLTLAACLPPATLPPPPPIPSEVTSQAGLVYFVRGLRIPGTKQELRLKDNEASTWVPFSQVQQIRFSGPVKNRYRFATITLTSGERIKGDLFVDFLLEGTTDLGYWNIRMDNVERLSLGID